jgi:hypothetical protein
MVMAVADVPTTGFDRLVTGIGRGVLLRSFLGAISDRAGAARCLGRLRAEGIVTEHHFTDAELARMDELARRNG